MTTTGRGIAVTGPKLIYTEDGNHCYAYSGSIEVEDGTTADITMMDFISSPSTYIIAKVVWSNAGISTDAFFEEIRLNGIPVFLNYYDAGPDKFTKQPIPILIPPYTRVEILYGSGSSTAVNSTAMLTGKVYNAE